MGGAFSVMKSWFMTIVTAVLLASIFKSFAFASFYIPSESMMPTLEVGDRLIVNKFAYGYSKYSLPFSKYLPSLPGHNGRVFYKAPKRGDVIVFSNPKNDVVTIKRLVGLPGDVVQVVEGQLFLNGRAVLRQESMRYSYREYQGDVVTVREFVEHLPRSKGANVEHKILEQTDFGYFDHTRPYTVPEGHMFMMGDNRDNSSDSRAMRYVGFVPIENIIGRADIISFSLYSCDSGEGLRCGRRKFLESIH